MSKRNLKYRVTVNATGEQRDVTSLGEVIKLFMGFFRKGEVCVTIKKLSPFDLESSDQDKVQEEAN